MCPDIETFAPLIHATFGAGRMERPGAPNLRVRLADRSIRQTNPVLGVVARLLELADERLTASQVLDLADREPVRRRFGFDDAAVARAEEWVRESGIRWGLDAEHRAPFKLDGLPVRHLARRARPAAARRDHDRGRASAVRRRAAARRRRERGDRAGGPRVAELLDRLHAAVDALRSPKPVHEWAEAIGTAADALTTTTPRDAWQRAELQRLLATSSGEAAGNAHRARPPGRSRAARRTAEGAPDAHELPHRAPDRLHARAMRSVPHASSACSASTTARSRASRRATATT